MLIRFLNVHSFSENIKGLYSISNGEARIKIPLFNGDGF